MNYKAQIKKIVSGIKIHSLKNFEVEGVQKYVHNQSAYSNFSGDLKNFGSNHVSDASQQRQNFIQSLTNAIYTTYYCGITQENNTHKIPSKTEREAFMDSLAKENTSKGGLDFNWLIYNVDKTGNAFIKKGEELRWLQPNNFEYQNPRQQFHQVNTYVNIKKTQDSRSIQHVFYHVFSDEIFPQEVELARIYWNVRPQGASKLIGLLTTRLNQYRIPFQFKCLNHPDLFVRSDSAVLYFDKRSLHIVSILLIDVIKELKEDLIDEIPMFTKKLAIGVGFAEDPGKGMSFGMSRSSVIAKAMVTSFEADDKNILKSVLNNLEKNGFLIEKMYLNKHTQLTPNFPKYE